MIDKAESLVGRMRWKLYHYLNERDGCVNNGINYGFKSTKSPPSHKALEAFEDDLFEMIRTIEFRDYINPFQKQMSSDIKQIMSSEAVFVPADKTTNMYKLSRESYDKLLHDNITAEYKKANDEAKKSIDCEAYCIADNLDLSERIDKFAESTAFITIKDHKKHFPNTIECRLINPAKSQIGKISKHHLQIINKAIRDETSLNQWQNTNTVISWFNNIPNKSLCKFLQLDIVNFYPSISERVLKDALSFAKSIVPVEDNIVEILMHCRKSLLFDGKNVWNKIRNPSFDVTMGSFDGAEICELVGLHLLQQMKDKFPDINFGLYRDDGLGSTMGINNSQLERMKKSIIQLYKGNDLNITIDMGLAQVDFLDITMNLENGKFWPYRKPNNEPLYINKLSNHPPNIIKELPKMIEKRVSELSCNADEFEKSKPVYEEALARSGYSCKLEYTSTATRRKNRPRNVIWFNPPYNALVKTDVGKQFLTLLSKHFPPHHKFRKLFNKNNVKLSYSCTKNMSSIISSHNKKVLSSDISGPLNDGGCNCTKFTCPMNGNCLENGVIYKAEVSCNNSRKDYIGSTEKEFKRRWRNHKTSLEKEMKKHPTSLSRHYWTLKNSGGSNPIVNWSRLRRSVAYRCGGQKCNLCLEEKLAILQAPPDSLINKRSELLNRCLHKRKHRLVSLKGDLT